MKKALDENQNRKALALVTTKRTQEYEAQLAAAEAAISLACC